MEQFKRTLLDIIGRALFCADINIPSVTNWNALFKEAKDQAVFPMVFDYLTREKPDLLPADLAALWRRDTMLAVCFNEQLLNEQKSVLRLMESCGIPCVILKGSSSAANYPNPSLRIMGDIDILVAPEHQAAAVEILQKNGYGEVLDESHHCHMTISKNNITVEVHKEPNGLIFNENKEIDKNIREFFSDAIKNRQFIGEIPILSDEHQAVALILHKLEHFLSGGLGLRQLCDWAVFVDRKMTDKLWEQLKPRLADFGLLYFTGTITKVCTEYLHLPKDKAQWVSEYDTALADEVMDRILQSGNFGRKENAYAQRYFVDAHCENRITSFIKTLKSACKKHWPICEKHPVLMPAAPFVIFFKYIKLRIHGERPAIHPVLLYKNAGSKQKLYKELKPFSVQKEQGE